MNKVSLPHSHDPVSEHVAGGLPAEEAVARSARYFQLLSDPTRLRLFWILCHCEECVVNLAAMMEMSSPALSHHLRLLRDHDLVTVRREGKEVHYRLAENSAAQSLKKSMERLLGLSG